MRYTLILLLFAIVGCHSQKDMTPSFKQIEKRQTVFQTSKKTKSFEISEKIELIPNSQIKLVNNETGTAYIKILNGDSAVFTYRMYKKLSGNIMDANSSEFVYFEWKGGLRNTVLQDEKLKDVNLSASFAGFRNTDAFIIDKGKLEVRIINEQSAEITINIDDKYGKLPVRNIHYIIQLPKQSK